MGCVKGAQETPVYHRCFSLVVTRVALRASADTSRVDERGREIGQRGEFSSGVYGFDLGQGRGHARRPRPILMMTGVGFQPDDAMTSLPDPAHLPCELRRVT